MYILLYNLEICNNIVIFIDNVIINSYYKKRWECVANEKL